MTHSVPKGLYLSTSGPVVGGNAGAIIGTLSTVDADPTATFTYTTSDPVVVVSGNQLSLAPGVALYDVSVPLLVTVTTTDQAGSSYTKALKVAVGPLDYSEAQSAAGSDHSGHYSGAYGTYSNYGVATWASGTSHALITSVAYGGGSASTSVAVPTLAGGSLADTVAVADTATGGGGFSGGVPVNPGATVSIASYQDPHSVPNGFLGIFGGAGGAATVSGTGGSIALGTGNDLASLLFTANGGRGGDGGNGEAAVTVFQGSGPYALRYDLAPGFGGTGGAGGDATTTAQGYVLTDGGSLHGSIGAVAIAGNGGTGGNGGSGGSAQRGTDTAQVGAGGAGGSAHGNVDGNQLSVAKSGGASDIGLSLVVTGGDAGADGASGHTDHPQGAVADLAGSAVASMTGNAITTGNGNDSVTLLAHVASGHGPGASATLAMSLNIVGLGAGNDLLTLDVALTVNGTADFSASHFNFGWNQFDGGAGFDTLDLSHFGAPQGLTMDVSLGKLFVTGQPTNASQVSGFEAFIGASNDQFIDGKGNQVYTGGDHAQFTFASGHGVDIVTDFGDTDLVIFKGFGTKFHTAAQVTAAMTDHAMVTGGDGVTYVGVSIATPGGGSVMLAGTDQASLVAHLSDFLFA